MASACEANPKQMATTHPQRDNILQPPLPGRTASACKFHHWNLHLNPPDHSIEFAESRTGAQVTDKRGRTSPLSLGARAALAVPKLAPMMAIIIAIARMSHEPRARAPMTGSGVIHPFIVGDRRITLRSAPRARPAGDWR